MRALRQLLGAPRTARAGRLRLRVITAHEMLQAQAEADLMSGGSAEQYGLRLNAAVIARAARIRGRRPFRSGGDVLRRYSPGQIERLAECYEALCKRDNLSCACADDERERLLSGLAAKPYERLKWRVLRSFSVLPSSKAARAMTDADYLYCALHTVLDGREYAASLCPDCRERSEQMRCPGCGAAVSGQVVNASFDEAEFEKRKCGQC